MPSVQLSESDLIKRIAGKIKTDTSVVCGIGDDTAVLRYTKGKYLLFTTDMLIEDVDFTKEAQPREIGHKALACSLSDIAAMGGSPTHALVSIGIPKQNPARFIDGFYEGMLRLARKFKVNIAGGDLSASGKVIIDVSMIGEVDRKKVVLRKGAMPGDIIFVSGPLGGSLYGRHLRFTPRIKEAQYLVNNYTIHAMLDISDGLSIDLGHLCAASKVGAVIYENLIPVSSDAKSQDEALTMGEDFELLFAMPVNEARRLIKNRGKIFKPLGEVREEKFGLKIISRDSKEKILEPKGYQHF